MAADLVHHSIERELKKCGNVRDFQEYIDTLERARCKVISMGATTSNIGKITLTEQQLTKAATSSRTWQLYSSEEGHDRCSTRRLMEAIALS